MHEHRLLLDLGNSRLKWAVVGSAGAPVSAHAVAHDGAELRLTDALQAAAHSAGSAWIASTALGLTASLVDALRACGIADPQVFRSQAYALGIRNAYALPETLGSDRFLAMAGARARMAGAALIADAGTALTLDLVDALGQHRGGLIVPGPQLMRLSLHRGTAGVRSVELTEVSSFASNTSDGVGSGVLQACAGLIERMQRQAARELGEAPTLMLSGGAMPAIAPLLECTGRMTPDLVLEGLAVWARTRRSDQTPPAS